ncbi:MAG: glucose-1-phosphate adenylyltransferase [Candidatus Fischerbacteria bacterium RBG_13_37_8]|uniref:Glucose-1-phosphate adenylyltransferase n=1 Tax=Candidatus Fischerbacteria bacterium RBG_13_37_8 TaxID=1817863 RepID=A0A1F5V952_9BACT|nr:MAG: glucose-1-phosphate adenylyltransferase [Candidatus Fischerbacteria bacterium RBG_13_37_8]
MEITKKCLGIVLAGGAGERLWPLTQDRAKPAVPFGGLYRIIDFTLSNCLNSNLRRVIVLTQYKAQSLIRHIRSGWSIFSAACGEFIEVIPAQQRVGFDWYLGTADAVFQNLYYINNVDPEFIILLSGDHVYKMDYEKMLRYHLDNGADATIGTIEFPVAEAHRFGIIQVNEQMKIIGFQEKPKDPTPLPYDKEKVFASMGVYIFNTKTLREVLLQDNSDKESRHDFGQNIIPKLISSANVYAYNFIDENKKKAQYWRDIGTLESYWESNMDLVYVEPVFNLYDGEWPIRTFQMSAPPAKFVFGQQGKRIGIAVDSIVSNGCIVSGGIAKNSVLSPWVRINSYSLVEQSILMDNVEIGRYCRIRRAIIDKNARIPPNTEIGYDLEEDRKKFFTSETGLVVVKAYDFKE